MEICFKSNPTIYTKCGIDVQEESRSVVAVTVGDQQSYQQCLELSYCSFELKDLIRMFSRCFSKSKLGGNSEEIPGQTQSMLEKFNLPQSPQECLRNLQDVPTLLHLS